jgi:Domain of unknown function (DUF4157)
VAEHAEPARKSEAVHAAEAKALASERPATTDGPSPLPNARAEPGLAANRRMLGARAAAGPQPIQRASAAPSPNRTGLPDRLKAGVEALSGLSMDDVRVHRNSSEPAKLGALAYAQGSDIHLGPGQEQHLPHEAWHVVQQKQGRVRANVQLRNAGINVEEHLESEADTIGRGAVAPQASRPPQQGIASPASAVIQRTAAQDRAALAAARESTNDPLLRNILAEALDLQNVQLSDDPDSEQAHVERQQAEDWTHHRVNIDPSVGGASIRQSLILHEMIHASADRRYNANRIGEREPALTAVIDTERPQAERLKEIGRQARHRAKIADAVKAGLTTDRFLDEPRRKMIRGRLDRIGGVPHREFDSVASELYYRLKTEGIDERSITFRHIRQMADGAYRSRHESVPLDEVYEAPAGEAAEGCCAIM